MAGASQKSDISPTVVIGVLRAADLLVIVLASLAAYLIRFETVIPQGAYVIVVMLVLLLSANVFSAIKLYDFQSLTSNFFQAGKILLGWTLVSLLVLSAGFLTKTSGDYSRIWATLSFTFVFVGLCVLRFLVKLLLARWRHQGRFTQKIAVVGAGDQGHRIVEHLNSQPEAGVELVGVFDDRSARVPSSIGGWPLRGDVDELLNCARRERIDSVIVALPWSAEDRLLEILQKLKTVPVDVRLCPEGVAYQFPNRPINDIRGINMLSVFEKPISHWDRVIKTLEDRLLAAFILAFISPLMALMALLIKLDSKGPVFFRQNRFGFNNEIIEVFKFRSMYTDPPPQTTYQQAQRDDPRVTPIGRFLRRTSVDELPQFLNVLQGTMSIVGPRPHPIPLNDQFAVVMEQYFARHNVKPGITGWAQVNGFRGETTTNESMRMRVRYDLYYIENWSVWFDLRIMFLTIFRGFIHKNAY